MKNAFRIAAALVIGCAASAVTAQGSLDWKSVGDWDIAIDPGINNGCFALASWDSGTELRIGRYPSNEKIYVLIGNSKWASLEADVDYDIEIQFGSRPVWTAPARGFQFNPGEKVYLHAITGQNSFAREFQKAPNMRIVYNGNEIDNLKLTGSSRAWTEVETCQREVANRGVENVEDPFATGGSSSSTTGRKNVDPFAKKKN